MAPAALACRQVISSYGIDYGYVYTGRDMPRDSATPLQRDLCDLICGICIYMVGNCHVRLLYIIHVSPVSGVDVLQRKVLATACVAQKFSFKTKLPPGDAQAHSSPASAVSMLDSV